MQVVTNNVSLPFICFTFFQVGTEVFTFLLLGDQNAGKSTFIHSFTSEKDAQFMKLCSFLPILNSTFSNARFVSHDVDCMDELPFLDTDLGRGTVMITVHDFLFFCAESGLPFREEDWGFRGMF